MAKEQQITLRRIIIKVIIDCLAIIIVALPYIILVLSSKKPYFRGFYCDDESIRYPYKADSITIGQCAIGGILIALFTIILCECLHFFKQYFKYNLSPSSSSSSIRVSSYDVVDHCVLPSIVACLYIYIGVYGFGAVTVLTFVEIGKVTIGRLRPNFIDVCKPDFSSYNCTDNMGSNFEYVQNYYCTGDDQHLIIDSRKSFPSGHSAFSVFTAIYIVLYLQARFSWRVSRLLKHMLQAMCIYLAFYVCLSRISDNKHHWSDVLSGSIIGFFLAALAAIHITNLFKFNKQPNSLNHMSDLESGL